MNNSNNNLSTSKNIEKISKITCDVKFNNNMSINPNIFVNLFELNGKEVIIKKEFFINKNKFLPEYNFIKKYSKLIEKNCFKNFILLSEQTLTCVDSYIYIYPKLNYNYDDDYFSKLNFIYWIKHTLEICLVLYYLNNYLKIYHNDLCYCNDLKNIMIINNNVKFELVINKYKYITNQEHIVLIDFGHQDIKPKLRTYQFYNNKYKKRNDYKYISEVFIIYYMSFKKFFKIDDLWNTNYDFLYDSIANKSNSLKIFDEQIIDFLFELLNKNQ